MCLEREFNKLLLEAAGNEFAAASERTAAGPRLDPREEHKVAVRSADTHPGAPVIVGIRVPSAPIADEARRGGGAGQGMSAPRRRAPPRSP